MHLLMFPFTGHERTPNYLRMLSPRAFPALPAPRRSGPWNLTREISAAQRGSWGNSPEAVAERASQQWPIGRGWNAFGEDGRGLRLVRSLADRPRPLLPSKVMSPGPPCVKPRCCLTERGLCFSSPPPPLHFPRLSPHTNNEVKGKIHKRGRDGSCDDRSECFPSTRLSCG